MSTLLVHIYGNRSFNRTMLRPHLYVYDDIMIYKKRHLFSSEEVTISYNMVAQVNLKKFYFLFAHLEIVTTGLDTEIKIKWALKKDAIKAKKIIDQKVHQTYAFAALKNPQTSKVDQMVSTLRDKKEAENHIDNLEKSLNRLEELLQRDKITKSEYHKKRQQLLKRHR